MIVTRKHISRRAVLGGAGAALALPLLDAMVPAFTPLRASPASGTRRLATVYVPNGVVMERWTPVAEGRDFDLPPTLAPLAPHREDLLVLSGLVHQTAFALPGEGAGDHARAAACYLTGAHPKKTEGVDIRAGVSMDQIAARRVGSKTPLPSLELGCDPGRPPRRLRRRIQLRLRQHALVEERDDAAPGRDRSPRRVRAVVRRRAGHERRRPPAAPRRRPQHPRRAARRCPPAAADARRRRPGEGGAVPRRRPRCRAAHPQRRAPGRPRAAGLRETGRHSGPLRGPCPDDVRPAGAGVPDGPDAGGDLHHVAGVELADLSRTGDSRPAPSALAPPERPGEDREAGPDQRPPHRPVRVLSGPAAGDRGTRTARCSTRRS